jgi:hypothetical protein
MTTLREAAQQALEALDSEHPDIQLRAAVALRKALAQPEPRNQCGETCERAKLCAVCARGLEEQEPAAKMHLFFEDNNGALRHTPEDCQAFGANGQPAAVYVGRQRYVPEQERADPAQPPCDIAEDGVCEVIDCCRKSPLILEALEIGYAAAQAEAAQYHAAMAGYRPERHAEMDADVQKIANAITAVKAALAQEKQEPTARYKCTVVDDQHPSGIPFEQWVNAPQQEQEPVAWMVYTEDGKSAYVTDNPHDLVGAYKAFALYTAPPHREWHPLTDKEIRRMGIETPGQQGGWNLAFARAVERALKEKNNG